MRAKSYLVILGIIAMYGLYFVLVHSYFVLRLTTVLEILGAFLVLLALVVWRS